MGIMEQPPRAARYARARHLMLQRITAFGGRHTAKRSRSTIRYGEEWGSERSRGEYAHERTLFVTPYIQVRNNNATRQEKRNHIYIGEGKGTVWEEGAQVSKYPQTQVAGTAQQ